MVIFVRSVCALAFGLVTICVEARESREVFLGLALQSYNVNYGDRGMSSPIPSDSGSGAYLSVGTNKLFGRHGLGFGIDVGKLAGHTELAYRALNYRYLIGDNMTIGAFFGASSLDTGLPQNGYYVGFSTTYLDLFYGFDLSATLRHGNGLARDRLLSDDPVSSRPDIFLDYTSAAMGLVWRF